MRRWMQVDLISVVAALTVGGLPPNATGEPLTDEYSVNTYVTEIGENTYRFEYYVSNFNQTVNDRSDLGLDGFGIMLPTEALVMRVENPNGSWVNTISNDDVDEMNVDGVYRITNGEAIGAGEGYGWLGWWGRGLSSIYGVGTTARFMVEVTNVDVGTNTAALTTFWWFEPMGVLEENDGYYSDYTTQIPSPVSIAPTPVLILGCEYDPISSIASLRFTDEGATYYLSLGDDTSQADQSILVDPSNGTVDTSVTGETTFQFLDDGVDPVRFMWITSE